MTGAAIRRDQTRRRNAMAALDGSFVDFETLDHRRLVTLQAVWRGAVVRKWLQSLRQVFEETCAEVDEKHASRIHWPRRSLCHPRFVKTQRVEADTWHLHHDTTEASERGASTPCSHCPVSHSRQRTLCPVSHSRQRMPCHRPTGPGRDPVLPSKISGDDVTNHAPSSKKTDDCSSHVRTVECVECSANNLVPLSCHGDEETLIQESTVSLKSNIQERALSTPELRPDDEGRELRTEEQSGQNTVASISTEASQYPGDRDELLNMRKNIAMELLWVQQAIDSRKHYLELKAGME